MGPSSVTLAMGAAVGAALARCNQSNERAMQHVGMLCSRLVFILARSSVSTWSVHLLLLNQPFLFLFKA